MCWIGNYRLRLKKSNGKVDVYLLVKVDIKGIHSITNDNIMWEMNIDQPKKDLTSYSKLSFFRKLIYMIFRRKLYIKEGYHSYINLEALKKLKGTRETSTNIMILKCLIPKGTGYLRNKLWGTAVSESLKPIELIVW